MASMDPDVSGRSEEEIQAIREALEVDTKVRIGRALLEKIELAVEDARYRFSESLIELDKKLRDR